MQGRGSSRISILGSIVGSVTLLAFVPFVILAQSDGVPPKITEIRIESTSATSTTIRWTTDEDSDSEINYGLDKNYGIFRDNTVKKEHEITVSDLEPSTLYHLRVVSSDLFGNQALSGDYTIVTKGVVNIKDIDKIPPEERAIVERAVAAIKQVKSVEGLTAIAEEVSEQAKKVLEAPVIIGTPRIDEIGPDYVTIFWATDQPASSVVRYARETEYNENSSDPYTTEAGEKDNMTQEHTIKVVGLTPGTTYHFRVESESDLGLKGQSRDGTFTTKAALPTISSFRVVKVEEDSATLAWRTNIPAAGVVEYQNTQTREVKSAGSPVFASTQIVKIAGLRLGNRYKAVVKAENAVGEKVTSQPLYFTTTKDKEPPIISKVSNESTLYPSADAKVQTIVSWATDEASYCQFFYREGLNPNIPPSGLGEEKEPRTNHVQVVVEFLPSTVYQFWVECRDEARNMTKSENFVLFTPNKEKSIIDIILENFSGAFGWVKNVGK